MKSLKKMAKNKEIETKNKIIKKVEEFKMKRKL